LIDTPLEISADKDGTSLGDFQVASESWSPTPEYGDRAKEIGQALRDDLSATFRITSRDNCEPPVACDCNIDIYGLWIGITTHPTSNDPGDAIADVRIGEYYSYEDGGYRLISAALLDTGWSILRWTKDDDGRDFNMYRVDLECTPSGWTVLIRTRCIRYDDPGFIIADTTDSWMGVMRCSEACESWDMDSNGNLHTRDAGDPIPLGNIEDVEYLGRESVVGECEPQDNPRVYIRQVQLC
jgi:hypothetical protein